MEYIFNEIQMRRYMSYRLGRKVKPSEFRDCKENFISWVDYIRNFYKEEGKEIPKQDGCSTELEVDTEEGDIEVWAIFKFEDNRTFIDFDYTYDDFIKKVNKMLNPFDD